MTDYKYETAGSERYATYADPSKRHKVWIVWHQSEYCSRSVVGSFFNERLARAYMAAALQPECGSMSLQVIDVFDIPQDQP